VGEERLPVAIDLGLVVAVDRQRDRLGELEIRAAIQPDERSAGEREVDGDDRSRGAARRVGRRAVDAIDAAVREERRVVPGRLLGVAVEPQARADLVHVRTSFARSTRLASRPGAEATAPGGRLSATLRLGLTAR